MMKPAIALLLVVTVMACSPQPVSDPASVGQEKYISYNSKAPKQPPRPGPGTAVANGRVEWWAPSNARESTRQTQGAVAKETPEDRTLFVVGISGGGNKSAVFASAVMLELQHFGLLQEVDAFSSASGGSFPALFYALSCDVEEGRECAPDHDGWRRPAWNRKSVNDLFDRNWLTGLIGQIFRDYTVNTFTYRDTHDSFVEVLEEKFLPGKSAKRPLQFSDLNPKRPALFINATNISSNRRNLLDFKTSGRSQEAQISNISFHFSFTQPYFERIQSDLSSYSVVRALVASAAYPVIIDPPTLLNWKFVEDARSPRREYVHLTDGGVHDNVGLMELAWAVECAYSIRLSRKDSLGTKMAGCDIQKEPTHVIAAVIDASLTSSTGADPLLPGSQSIRRAFPINIGVTMDSVDFMSYGNTIQRKAAMAGLIEDIKSHIPDPRRAAVYLPLDLQGLSEIACAEADPNTVKKGNTDEEKKLSLQCQETANTIAFAKRHNLHAEMKTPPAILLAASIAIPVSFQSEPQERAILREAARWIVLRHLYNLCQESANTESEKQKSPTTTPRQVNSIIDIVFGREKYRRICQPDRATAERR